MGALQFDKKLLNLAGECERELGDSFSRIRETELITGTRVVSAFIENSVMINHLSGSTGLSICTALPYPLPHGRGKRSVAGEGLRRGCHAPL